MTTLNALRARLRRFEFTEAFLELLGWNHARGSSTLEAAGRTFVARAIAEKGSVRVLEITEPMPPDPEGTPQQKLTAAAGRGLRDRIDQKARELHGVCVLAFINADRTECYWRFPRADGKGRTYPERRYYRDRKPIDSLLAVLRHLEIPYELQDELGNVAHSLMLDRFAQSGARADRVTNKFFKDFDRNRKQFEGFLAWVDDEKQRTWYVTALLNRVMFIYFLQERGLLPDGNQYLANRLVEWKLRGANRFYREFLLPLCFFGFGTPEGERGKFEADFRGVPYLDGGLFQVHEVEARLGMTREAVLDGTLPPGIGIPDDEFDRWFGFLGSWRWTLDEEALENEGQINPGILGYIFEKYINQRELGAYYTKEDITGYICRSTIVPRLFDMLAETGSKGRKSVDPLPIGPHPNLLNDGKGMSQGEGIDRYVYEAAKTTEYLPTETEREYAARNERYAGILQDFEAGKVRTVNDCISYNLDLEKLTRDFVLTIQDPEVLWAFYDRCLKRITILDPTVGSGAFLLAAVNILFPLYRAALYRMSELCANAEGATAPLLTWKDEFAFANEVDTQLTFTDPAPPAVLADMRAELSRVNDEHPNPEYFVYKTIIVNNVFGVDIVEEAVEICKLRLFLKLIAHAAPDASRPNLGIEPLPDIDFNVLAGNTLVGYARAEDFASLWEKAEFRKRQGALAFDKDVEALKRACREYGLVVQRYRDQQLGIPSRRSVSKSQVRHAADLTRAQLDEDLWNLHRQAGAYPDPPTRRQKDFLGSHQPFHWFLEFASVFEQGGFDCAVGNPPYVVYSAPRVGYAVEPEAYLTYPNGNLYALCFERALRLCKADGYTGLIVQLTVTSSERAVPLQDLISLRGPSRVVSFPRRPESIFDGVEMPVSIVISKSGPDTGYETTRVNRFYTEERPHAMTTLHSTQHSVRHQGHRIAKFGSPLDCSLFETLARDSYPLGELVARSSPHLLYYQEACRYWVRAFHGLPFFRRNGEEIPPPHGRIVPLAGANELAFAYCILNSSLFYWAYSCFCDCEHVNDAFVKSFPVCKTALKHDWRDLARRASDDIARHAMRKRIQTKQGHTIEYDEVKVGRSKRIIDEIDTALGACYALTPTQLDAIINYDLKYRMGSTTE